MLRTTYLYVSGEMNVRDDIEISGQQQFDSIENVQAHKT